MGKVEKNINKVFKYFIEYLKDSGYDVCNESLFFQHQGNYVLVISYELDINGQRYSIAPKVTKIDFFIYVYDVDNKYDIFYLNLVNTFISPLRQYFNLPDYYDYINILQRKEKLQKIISKI